jgi:hypothetical protein
MQELFSRDEPVSGLQHPKENQDREEIGRQDKALGGSQCGAMVTTGTAGLAVEIERAGFHWGVAGHQHDNPIRKRAEGSR